MLGVEYVITLRRTIRSQRRSKSRSETTWDSPDWKCCDKKELPFSLMGKVDGHWLFFWRWKYIKFIYSEKATKFCEIFSFLLSYAVPVKSLCNFNKNAHSERISPICQWSVCLNMIYLVPKVWAVAVGNSTKLAQKKKNIAQTHTANRTFPP